MATCTVDMSPIGTEEASREVGNSSASGGRWRKRMGARTAPQVPWEGEQSELADAFSGRQRCPICLETVPADADCDADLPCGHMACASCIVLYLESRVNAGEVSPSDLCCPLPECRQPMPDAFISGLLTSSEGGTQLHQRLLDFQAQRFVPEPEAGECLVTCPSAGCGKLLVPVEFVTDRRDVVCPLCTQPFCASCCHPAHAGVSCKEAEHETMDPELRRLIAAENLKQCPSCRHLCQRESGCNFMTCPSEQCKGQTYFCYICEEALAASDHAAHYEGFEGAAGRAGPFGSVCLNRREVNLSLPSRPCAPALSVVPGDDEGSMALRITWGSHQSEPPTIYYKVHLSVPAAGEVRHLTAQAGYAYHDLKQAQRYRRYQVSVTPVNVNGSGPTSEASEVVHFHQREMEIVQEAPALKSKRWAKNS